MYLLILSIALNIVFISGYAENSTANILQVISGNGAIHIENLSIDLTRNTLQMISGNGKIYIKNLVVDSFPQAILRIKDELLEIPKKLYELNLIQKADISEATQLITTFIDTAYWSILTEDTIMTDLYKALKNYRLFIEGCAIARFNQINPEAIWTKYPAYILFLMNFLLRERNLDIDTLLWQEQFPLSEILEEEVLDQKQPKLIINPNMQKILETAIKYFAPTIPKELPTYGE